MLPGTLQPAPPLADLPAITGRLDDGQTLVCAESDTGMSVRTVFALFGDDGEAEIEAQLDAITFAERP